MRRDSSITEIKGIGEKTKKLFEKMGVYTVGDILLHFPRNYIQYPHPVPIDEMTAEHMQTEDKLAIVARIERTPVTRSGRHMQVTLLVIGSPGHQIQLIWYRMPYIRNTLTHGSYFVFYGNVQICDGTAGGVYAGGLSGNRKLFSSGVYADQRDHQQSHDKNDAAGIG